MALNPKKRKRRDPLTMLFKKRRSKAVPKRKKMIGLKKGKEKKKTFQKKLKRRILTQNLSKYISYALAVVVIGLALYQMVTYVVALRLQNTAQEGNVGFVIGFEKIPEYPESSFIFEDYLEEEEVKKFLSEGMVVYRTSPGTKLVTTQVFYKVELPKYNWELVKEVGYESDEMKPGQYWVKDGKAVRIYSRLNDLWYESVTVAQAQSGLADEVTKEREREQILLASDGTDLLPDYPWKLTVPSEYLVSYSSTDLEDLRNLNFLNLNRQRQISIEPIGYYTDGSYDGQIDNYLSKLNERDGTSWGILNSALISVSEYEAIRVTMVNDQFEEIDAVVLGNSTNSTVYAIFNWEGEDQLFLYIQDNILIKGATL